MADFSIHQGTTRRITLVTVDVDANPYLFNGTTVRLRVEFVPVLDKVLTVDASGAASGSADIMFGRVNPADKDGPLIDTTSSSGYLTIRFAPEDTAGQAEGSYGWECRVERGPDVHALDMGVIRVTDSIF